MDQLPQVTHRVARIVCRLSAPLPREATTPNMFLDCLSPAAAAELEKLGGRRRYRTGETLFLEGDRAGEALALLSGAVKISVGSVEGREVILDVLEPGSLIGELSAIDGEPRSATVVALSPVEVLAVAAVTSSRSAPGTHSGVSAPGWPSSPAGTARRTKVGWSSAPRCRNRSWPRGRGSPGKRSSKRCGPSGGLAGSRTRVGGLSSETWRVSGTGRHGKPGRLGTGTQRPSRTPCTLEATDLHCAGRAVAGWEGEPCRCT